MFDKLTTVEARYEDLMTKLGTTEVQSDQAEYKKAAKALSELEPLVQAFRDYKAVEQDIAGATELTRGADAEMRQLARYLHRNGAGSVRSSHASALAPTISHCALRSDWMSFCGPDHSGRR
jgi:protein subunit release factor A